jgi:cytidylate kinase
MPCSAVCISHATGAGGEEVGRLVAEDLGFLFVDDEIVARAAADGGIDPAEVADEERRKSLAARLVVALGQGGEAWAVSHSGSPSLEARRSDDVRALIRETIAQTATRGRVVIVAHGASHVVPRGQEALRVLVTASPTTRARRVGDAKGLDDAGAMREVKRADAARRDYLRRFYDIDEELPTQYDLVVNTDLLSVEQVARLVVQAASG